MKQNKPLQIKSKGVKKMTDYDLKAIKYSERYGVRDYKLKKNIMTYREKYPTEGIYKATVNLETMEEVRKQLYKR